VIHLSNRSRSRSAAAGTAAAVAAAGLLLAACSSGAGAAAPSTSSSAVATTASPSPSPTRPPVVPIAPLTGQPARSAAALTRPIVVVDVGFTGDGAGLRGVGQADLIYQEFDNPGVSRLIAAFQSQDATTVGPVAPTSPVDVRVVDLWAVPVLAFNGGPTGSVRQVGPTVVTPRSTKSFATLFHLVGSSYFASTAALRASAPTAAPAPQGLLSFGGPTAKSGTGARAVKHLTVRVPGQAAQSWSFNGTGWVGPGGVIVTNLVVQTVSYKTLTSAKDPTVHAAVLIGTGPATVIGGGYAVACTWVRAQPLKITNYFDSSSLSVALTPGRTWIILAPLGTAVATS
jgi:Protein of unknown function (DUF3048) N-terminal domain/Protein of unknown function (DUF3048) C-terminal domain